MRSCTIVKTLVLSLGAIAVVARSLPQQRSEINAHAAGEDGFSNNATKRDGADRRLEANAALSKRDRDYRGATCDKWCDPAPGMPERNRDDCKTLYEILSAAPNEMITVQPGGLYPRSSGNCAVWLGNLAEDTALNYDLLDLADQVNGLNDYDCNSTAPRCTFDESTFIVVGYIS